MSLFPPGPGESLPGRVALKLRYPGRCHGRQGQPHPVFRPFAEHLAKHLIAPSARFNGRMSARTHAGVAGRFTYEPPLGVQWKG